MNKNSFGFHFELITFTDAKKIKNFNKW